MNAGVWDAVVVGAGPAGLIAARTLAADGHAVLVVEEHATVGYPVHCTGLLGTEAFDELDLPRDTIRGTITRAFFHGPEGPPVPVESDHISAAVIDRGDFDAALAAGARTHGASFRLGTRVESLAVNPSGVEFRLSGGAETLRARACILACGANYRFNRDLGLGVPSTLVQSAQAEIPFPAAAHVDVYIGRELAPNGFGWVVPFERAGAHWARLGLMCTENARARFAMLAARVWREHDLQGPLPEPRLKALPLGPVERTFADRTLAAGDAAGLVKPTTGGGIYYSLLSGRLAATVLSSGLKDDVLDRGRLEDYERQWSGRLGGEIRAGRAFRRLATRLDDRGISSLLELARVDGLVPILKRHGNFNWHRGAVVALLRNSGFRRAVLSSFWS